MNIKLKKRTSYHTILFLLTLLISSCTSIYNLKIQVAEPGKSELPEDIQSVLLVNRSVDDRFTNLKEDSLQKVFYEKQFKVDTTLYDTIAADTCIRALGEILFESGRYDIVIPEERFLPHKKNRYFTEEMNWDEVESLCSTFNTDVVISLDYFNTNVITDYSSETMYDGLEDRYYKAYYAKMAIIYNALIRVYDPLKKQIINRSFLSDTLMWEDADLSTRALFSRFTSVKKAMTESAIAIALDYSEQIAPTWRTQNRKYFNTGNEQMDKAHKDVLADNWEEAYKIWSSIAANSNSKGLKSKAEYNIALFYELNGEINEAIKWGLKSYDTQFRNETYDYLVKLKYRKKELESRAKE